MAQREDKSAVDKEKLESAKIAFITKRLDLTPEQAEKFWPLYNQHSKDKRTLMRGVYDPVQKDEKLTDEKALELIDRKFSTQQKILELEKGFLKKIVQVITPVQALQLEDVNKDFARHIYRMQKRKKGN